MFFGLEISYVVREVNNRDELRKFLGIKEKVKLKSDFMSKFEDEQFISFVFSVINVKSKRKRKKLILDWTDISLDLNPFRKRDLENKPYKWGYSTKGSFLGKMIILIDYETLTPLFIHVYPANVHESKIYPSMLLSR